MPFKNLPIKRKMMLVVMVTSITALVLTAASFITYDLVTFRQSLVRNLTLISTIVAENGTSALLFDDEELATRNLSEFKARAARSSLRPARETVRALSDQRSCERIPSVARQAVWGISASPSGGRIRRDWRCCSNLQPRIRTTGACSIL